MDGFKLVSVNARNLKEYSQLFNEIFPQDVPTTDLAKVTDYERWLVVDDTDEAFGICGIYGLKGYAGDIWMDWYGILPERRGEGHGRAVLMQMLDKAKARGAKRFMIWTTWLELEGTKLADFYRACGFHKTSWMLHYNDSNVFTFDKMIGEGTPVCKVCDLEPDDWLH